MTDHALVGQMSGIEERITVHKLNARGEEVWRYQGILLKKTDTSLTIEAFFDREEIEFHGITLRPHDRFIETYYTDQWYNIFEIHDVEDDHLKGWYCNITRPAKIKNGHIYAEDLALDLLVKSGGDWHILDEEEYAELELSPSEDHQARKALKRLIDLAKSHRYPFILPEARK
jgi:protein associated with RNAse G/E